MKAKPKPKSKRLVTAPAAVGRGAVNRINSAMAAEDEDVEWIWTSSPDGGQFVSGYNLVSRSTKRPAPRRKRGA